MQHNTIQYNTIQYNTIQYNTIQYNTIQYNTIQHNATQHNTTQHGTTRHNTTQHNIHNTIFIQYSTILICNRAGFCSIRENIRASLVEPWFVPIVQYPWRDHTSPDIFPNRAKTCTITCLSSLTEKCILKTKDKFWREFCN